MNALSLPTLNPALAPATPAASASKPAGAPGPEGAETSEGFARELDRAGAKRPDAAPSRGAERERPARGAAARAPHAESSRPAEGAAGTRRAAATDPDAVAPTELEDAAPAAPDDSAGERANDEPVDVIALIAGGRDVDARAGDALPGAANLPPAAALGEAVAAAAHDRHAGSDAGAEPRARAGLAVASARRDRSATSGDESLARPDPFGHTVAQLAHDRSRAAETAGAARPGPLGQTVAALAHERHAAQAPATSAGLDAPSVAAPLPSAGRESPALPVTADPAATVSAASRVASGEVPGADTGSAVPPAAAGVGAAQAPGLAHGPFSAVAGAHRHDDVHEPVGSPRFAPALGERVVTLVRDGVEQAQMRLNPAELGPIAVHIRVDGTRAEVEFSAAQALTRQALQDAVPALAGALRESGLTLAGGGVFEQPREARDPGADAAPRGGPGAGSGPERSTDAQLAAPVRGRARGIVDLFA